MKCLSGEQYLLHELSFEVLRWHWNLSDCTRYQVFLLDHLQIFNLASYKLCVIPGVSMCLGDLMLTSDMTKIVHIGRKKH